MAKPAGPLGNSPRDVRDESVGIEADPIKAPEPMRWPPKRKKITSNTFHAKVSGGSTPSRADRKPHFRRGGFVKGFASGGTVAGGPVDKNDPGELARKGLKKGGAVAKRAEGGSAPGSWEEGAKVAQEGLKAYKRQDGGGIPGPTKEDRDAGIEKLSTTMKKEMKFRPGEAKAFDNPRTQSSNVSRTVKPEYSEERGGYKAGGDVTGEFSLADQDKYGTSTFRGGKYENEPAVATGRTKNFNQPMGQRASEDIGAEKGSRKEHYKDGGKLSAAQRQAMPKSDFALPGKGEGPKGAGSGSYPINNPSHARNALARSSGKPEESAVRAAVHRKYPDIGQK